MAPWLAVCVPLLPFMVHFGTPERGVAPIAIAYVFSATCLFGLLAAINSRRFGWMLIFVTGAVPAAYLWYFCDTYFVDGKELSPGGRTSEATPWNALLGFLFIGVPCLLSTVHQARRLLARARPAITAAATTPPTAD
ncbi:MAG TPA: hypothetical protein VGE76_06050 [Opitutaceae bacterium]